LKNGASRKGEEENIVLLPLTQIYGFKETWVNLRI
jgi:hypothetical protein